MIRVEQLHRTYGALPAIDRITFEVRAHELVSVVGPSGCGKTTLLKCMAGLLAPSGGAVRLDGKRITRPPAMVAPIFQDYGRSLFPWMTVRQNVAFPLRRTGRDRAVARASVETAVASINLTHVLDRYPWQLSGGMQQRIAIARALACRPRILLMDEPFASVDAQTRSELEDLVLTLFHAHRLTGVLVTHDIDEAVYLSDRVVILTPAPATVQETLAVDLPRPRDQASTRQLHEFARLRTHVYRSIAGGRAPRVPAPPHRFG